MPQAAQFSIELDWKSFNVDLPSIDAFCKTLTNGYVGNSAADKLRLYFTVDPTIIPTAMTTVQQPVAATVAHVDLGLADDILIAAKTAGAAGNVTLTADGVKTVYELVEEWNEANPSNELQTTGNDAQVAAAGSIVLAGGADATTTPVQELEPTGAPSVAAQIQTKWDSILSTSAEAVAYTTNAATALNEARAGAAIDFGALMLKQFAGANLGLGITQAGMTKTVRLAMQDVTDCLSTGSLIEAIAEIKAIPQSSYDATFITPARLLAACNQLETFCGLPLSTSLS